MQHYSWDTVPVEVLSETISRKIITGDRLMVAQVFIKKGGIVPRHAHENEQVTYILEGALQFELEGQTVIVAKGQVLHIPSNVPHEAVALEDTIDLDIFNPPRQDWITGQDTYLRS
jgi:quercetin dioxygenase-like cupin family protein